MHQLFTLQFLHSPLKSRAFPLSFDSTDNRACEPCVLWSE
jgi:hypothetical protein